MSTVLITVFAGLICDPVAFRAPPQKPSTKEPTYYYPVKVGAKWVFEKELWNKDEVLVVTLVTKGDAGFLVTVEQENSKGERSPNHKMLVSAEGLWLTEEQGEPYSPPWQVLKVPHKAGDKWDVTTERAAAIAASVKHSVILCRVAAEPELLKVPSGKFDALKVSTTKTKVNGKAVDDSVSWYAAGIGLLKQEWKNGRTIGTLKVFTPGKD